MKDDNFIITVMSVDKCEKGHRLPVAQSDGLISERHGCGDGSSLRIGCKPISREIACRPVQGWIATLGTVQLAVSAWWWCRRQHDRWGGPRPPPALGYQGVPLPPEILHVARHQLVAWDGP